MSGELSDQPASEDAQTPKLTLAEAVKAFEGKFSKVERSGIHTNEAVAPNGRKYIQHWAGAPRFTGKEPPPSFEEAPVEQWLKEAIELSGLANQLYWRVLPHVVQLGRGGITIRCAYAFGGEPKVAPEPEPK